MKPQIETGHCSECGGAVERGRSGVWWHTGEPCGRGPAHFVPAPDTDAAERQQPPPRNRMITNPGRDR